MTPSRRTLLAGGGALAVVAASTAIGLGASDGWMTMAARQASAGSDLVLLHAGDVSAPGLERALRREVRPVRLTTHRMAGLAGADFGRMKQILARSRGRGLFAVLDDAQALVVETVLSGSVLNRRFINTSPFSKADPVNQGSFNRNFGRRGLILLTGTIQE